MTFNSVKPVQKSHSGTGISARLHARRDGVTTFHLNMNKVFQDEHFDGCIEGEFVAMTYGTGADAGKMQVTIAAEGGGIVATAAPNGGVKMACTGWALLGKDSQKTAACHFVESVEGGIIVRLPDWANGKEKLEKEFGLKG